MSRALNNVFKLAVRRDVERDFGAVDSLAVDSGAAIAAGLLWAGGSPERQVEFRGKNFLSLQQQTLHRGKAVGRSLLKISGLGAAVDNLIIQGSLGNQQAVWEGISLDCTGSGRDAMVFSGGKAGATQAKYAIVRDMQIIGSVRDALHQEPALAGCWLESCIAERVEIVNAGRNGVALIQGTLASTFNNKGTWRDIQVRGAGLVSTGYDFYCENSGTVGGQKISGHNLHNCEFDAKGAAFHGTHSMYFNQLGPIGGFAGWGIDATFEDTTATLALAEAIFVSTAGALSHPRITNEGIANYTDVVNLANMTMGGWIFTSNTDKTAYLLDPNHKIRFNPSDNAYLQPAAFPNQIKTPGILWGGFKEASFVSVISAGAIAGNVGNTRVNLNANVTAITFPTGTGAELDRCVVSFTFCQDATGSRTVAGWPGGVLLSGGAFAPTATAFKGSTIAFRYDSGQAAWYEITRSLNL